LSRSGCSAGFDSRTLVQFGLYEIALRGKEKTMKKNKFMPGHAILAGRNGDVKPATKRECAIANKAAFTALRLMISAPEDELGKYENWNKAKELADRVLRTAAERIELGREIPGAE